MLNQYFINISNGDERGFVYERNEFIEHRDGESFCLYDFFLNTTFPANRNDYQENEKEDYDMLNHLSYLLGEEVIQFESYKTVNEDIIRYAIKKDKNQLNDMVGNHEDIRVEQNHLLNKKE